jgi:DNA-binding GntR family transcriptional regulator
MARDDRPIPDRLYDEVRARIVTGELPPGAPVRQDTLAAELDASKIPLREALSRLEHDGLVVLNPRRGYEVAPLKRETAEEVFDLRLRIEPAAAALASTLATEEDRATAEAALAALDRATAGADPKMPDLNRAFHLALVRPAGRPLTAVLIERLHVLAERYVRAHVEPEGRSQRARTEHRGMYDAWAAGKADTVDSLLRAHIAGALDDLRAQLKD